MHCLVGTNHSGIPQGSHLGPLVFNLFINNLPPCVLYTNALSYFALSIRGRSANVCLSELYASCKYMSLNLNICKLLAFCKRSPLAMNYYFDIHKMESVTNCMDLGAILDAKLSFRLQVQASVDKAKALLTFIRRPLH